MNDKKNQIFDKTIPRVDRILLEKENVNKMMNPVQEEFFSPDDFNPFLDDENDLPQRQRKTPEKEAYTHGLKPKEFLKGQMIGMYESKQDIYLFFAHRCNELQTEIDLLKEELK